MFKPVRYPFMFRKHFSSYERNSIVTQIDLDWMIRSILDVSIYFVILGIPKLYLERPSKYSIILTNKYST